MRKGFLILAIICGLIAAGSSYLYLRQTDKNNNLKMATLVVAKTNIAARSVIKEDQLATIEVPTKGYPQGGFSKVLNVTGTVSLVNLKAGDPILDSMLEKNSWKGQEKHSISENPSSLTVPVGKRAVAIPIGLVSGVGYAVKPGDHVDVLVTMEIKNEIKSQTVTSLAAQDVLVLSAGESLNEGKDNVAAKSYTLALTVPQAMAVTLGSEKGSLRLMLRNPANQELRQDLPINQDIFLDPNYYKRFK